MKNIYTILICWVLSSVALFGQHANSTIPDFDPTLQPVAIEADSGVIINTVSEYVLIKSLRAQLPAVGKIVAVRRVDFNGQSVLQYETDPRGNSKMPLFLNIPLVKTAQGAYFVSSEGGTSCSGCQNNCRPESSPPCGCCNQISSTSSQVKITLKKVNTLIELARE